MMSKLKEKLMAFWQWLKGKIRELLVALGIIGVAVAATMNQPTEIPFIQVAEGQKIEFAFADDNTDENLIIRSEKQDYSIMRNEMEMAIMVENKSGKDQNIKFNLFSDPDGFELLGVKKLQEDISYDVQVPVMKRVETPCNGSSTKMVLGGKCKKEVLDSYKKETKKGNVFGETKLLSNISYQQYTDMPGRENGKGKGRAVLIFKNFSDTLKSGEIGYYKLAIKTPDRFDKAELYVEAIGDNGGYGLLDPNLLSDNFNGYADGDLNGQGAWSGDTTFDVQGVTVLEGKAVSFTDDGTYDQISNTFAAQSDATQWWYVRAAQTNKRFDYQWQIGGNLTAMFIVRDDGHFWVRDGNCAAGIAWVDLGAFSANTWYSVKFETRSSDNKFQMTANGTASGWQCGMYDRNPNSINTFVAAANANGGTQYFDYFWSAEYVPSAPPSDFMYYIAE